MIELLVLGVLGLVALAVVGVLWAGVSLVFWVLFLPFKLLAFVFRGLGFLLVLPLLAIVAVFGLVIFGAGALLFAIPLLPLLAVVGLVVWLAMRAGRPRVRA